MILKALDNANVNQVTCLVNGSPVDGFVFETIASYPSRQYVDIFQGILLIVQKYCTVGSQTVAAVGTITNGATTLNWILSDRVNSITFTGISLNSKSF